MLAVRSSLAIGTERLITPTWEVGLMSISTDHPELTSLARGLLRHYNEYIGAKRPIERKTTQAFMDGMVDAAFRMGIGHTPTEVLMMVHDTCEEIPVPDLPPHHLARKEWDRKRIDLLARKLRASQVGIFMASGREVTD
jgi:hypothetical protein